MPKKIITSMARIHGIKKEGVKLNVHMIITMDNTIKNNLEFQSNPKLLLV
ncbi:MAG: hypothetical protein A4E53_02351 [Pelotomaculum sp. PtaB.Bin104]|nr:MAG: hypothetical protein A4E53_02351 [Pelotomaculum sp. PtaB.Bin104]